MELSSKLSYSNDKAVTLFRMMEPLRPNPFLKVPHPQTITAAIRFNKNFSRHVQTLTSTICRDIVPKKVIGRKVKLWWETRARIN